MLNLLICDDDINDLKTLLRLVEQIDEEGKFHVTAINDPTDIKRMIVRGMTVDVLLIDIRMGDNNGIDIVQEIQRDHPFMQIIYVTVYDNYHTMVYNTEHACFLKKPVKASEMEQALGLALDRHTKIKNEVLFVVEKGNIVRLRLAEILYMEGVVRKTTVITNTGPMQFSQRLVEISKDLGENFLLCHKSYIVNLRWVRRMTYGYFELENGDKIPISQRRQKQTKEAFLRYIGGGK